MEIITNNKPRYILSFSDLEDKHQKEMINTFGEEAKELQFFVYMDNPYCLDDFCVNNSIGDNWDAASGTSYSDAIVIKLIDRDKVIVGRALW